MFPSLSKSCIQAKPIATAEELLLSVTLKCLCLLGFAVSDVVFEV